MDPTIACPEESFGRSPSVDVLVLVTISAFVCFWGLRSGPGLSDHEAIVAQSARQIRQSGDWGIPRFGEEPRIRKPPLALWLAATSSLVVDAPGTNLPVTDTSARFPSAVAGLLTTILVYALGRSMFGHRTGLVAAAVMTTCVGGMYFSHNAQVEMVLTLLVAASMAFFWFGTEGRARRGLYLVLFYASFALSMMAKAPLPLVALVAPPVFIWWFVTIPLWSLNRQEQGQVATGRFRARMVTQIGRIRELRPLAGLGIVAGLFCPWVIYVLMHVDNAMALWKIEYLGRATGDLSAKVRPFWYYVPIAFGLTVPFCLSLPEAVASPFLDYHAPRRRALLYLLTWAVVPVLLLSVISFKRPHYITACVPAMALLLGPTLERLFLAARTFSRAHVRAAVWTILAGVGIGLIVAWFVLKKEYPRAIWTFQRTGPVLMIGVVASSLAFLRGRRVLSLLTLHVVAAGVFAVTWDGLGANQALQWKALRMAEAMKALSLEPESRVTWVKGRADARVTFYLGREIPSLFSPRELASRRKDRKAVSQDLLEEGFDRILAALRTDRKEYFVLEGKHWNMLQAFVQKDVPWREVFRISEGAQQGENDWVLITNAWNRAGEPALSASGMGIGGGPDRRPSAGVRAGGDTLRTNRESHE